MRLQYIGEVFNACENTAELVEVFHFDSQTEVGERSADIDRYVGDVYPFAIKQRGDVTHQPLTIIGFDLDGVFIPRAQAGLLPVSDIDRIEIVRGPQGTIFGKSTIGGAVNVITRQPEAELGGSAELRIGNFGLLETRGVLNVPLVPEKLAARLSVATATRAGSAGSFRPREPV